MHEPNNEMKLSKRVATFLNTHWQILLLSLLSIIFVIISVAIEYGSIAEKLLHLYDEEITKASLHTEYIREYLLSGFWAHTTFWGGVSRELGFAFIIAIIIGTIVERRAREKHYQEAQIQMHRVAQNAFSGILDRFVPTKISDTVVNQILKRRIVREDYRLRVTINELTADDLKEITDEKEKEWLHRRFIRLEVTSLFRFRSVTHSNENHQVMLIIPLPSPDHLRKKTQPYRMTVGGDNYTGEEILEKLRIESDSAFEKEFEKKYVIETVVPGDKPLDVEHTYTVYKRRSDNEIWSSLVPTIGFELTVNFNLPNAVWHYDNMHSSDFKFTDGEEVGPFGPGQKTMRSDGVILPYQGMGVYWRTTPSQPKNGENNDC